jgi:hypothetical protein
MSDIVTMLRALIDWLWPIGATLGGLTGVAALVAMRTRPPHTKKVLARIVFLGFSALLAATIALGTGSCFVGSAIARRGICPFTPRGARASLDPIDDFMLMQVIYLGVSVLCFTIALGALLHVLPGSRTGWERLVFIISFGARGSWS